MQLTLTTGKRLLLLLCIFIICFFITSVISGVVVYKFGMSTPALRIVTVIQDVVAFVIPAVATAMLVTRQPARLLRLDMKPQLSLTVIAICALIVFIPAMNEITYLNQNLPLPESLRTSLQSYEDNANAMVESLMGPRNVPNLIMSILIIGLLTGLSEELLFRGAFQRLLTTSGMNPHIAIWIAAAVFSAFHMQFLGFAPRLLLGAYFGYLLYWTKSIWVPVILHAFNNTVVVIFAWLTPVGTTSAIDNIGAGNDYGLVALSFAITAFDIWCLVKLRERMSSKIGPREETY